MSDPALLPHILPVPGDSATLLRWDHTRLRRRMLTGQWKDDLTARLTQEVGTVKQSAWGVPKITSNPFAVICREMSALYTREPEVRAPQGDPIFGPLADEIKRSGLWAKSNDYMAMVLGLREAFWRIDVAPTGRVSYRPVWPDMVKACADPSRPDQPIEIEELRWRDGYGWCWDCFELLDPDAEAGDEPVPSYTVTTWAGMDITEEVLGQRFEGATYPYRYSDGTPFLPYVMYRAKSLGDCLFHHLDGIETVEASLDLAVNYTQLGHVLKDASWPQRWMLGCHVAGLDVSENGARRETITDPATVINLEEDPEAKNPQVGQWATSASPVELENVISSQANRIAVEAGLPPNDIQRMGGTARSGYAIALSNEGKRTAARKFAPGFRASDEELVSKTAALINRALGLGLPEYGYSVLYQDLPLSPDELQARRTNIIELLGSRLISRLDAYLELHPGMTREQARSDLATIDAESTLTTGA